MLGPYLFRVVLAIAVAAPCAAAADGQNVHRCIGEHGEISFSGTPCGSANAQQIAGSSAASPVLGSDRASSAPTCPASADALRDVIAEAFARRDANTIAGVMRWDGVGGAAARERMRELAELTGHPLLGIVSGSGTDGEPHSDELQLTQTTSLTVRIGSLVGGASEHEFRLTPAAGCYWLNW